MGFKYTGNVKLLKAVVGRMGIAQFTEQLNKTFKDGLRKEMPRAIIGALNAGRSPVQGGLYKKTYSDSYKKTIQRSRKSLQGDLFKFGKKTTPVNLRVTGTLHKSLLTEDMEKGLRFTFTDEKAKFHDILGAGKSKVIRRMLPKEGEKFLISIQKIIDAVLNKVLIGFTR